MNSFIPASDVILNAGLSLFSKVSAFMLGFVALIFMMRVVTLQLRFSSIYEYASVLKETVLYFIMLSLFPMLIKLIYEMCGTIALKISYSPVTAAQGKLDEFLSTLFFQYPIFKVAGKLSEFLIINLAQGMYSLFTALLLSIAPVFIFMSTVLGFEKGLPTYFSAVISISLWPVVWNLIGLLGKELFNSYDNSTLTVVVYWVVIQVFQLLSPIFCMMLMKSLSPGAVVTKIVGTASKL